MITVSPLGIRTQPTRFPVAEHAAAGYRPSGRTRDGIMRSPLSHHFIASTSTSTYASASPFASASVSLDMQSAHPADMQRSRPTPAVTQLPTLRHRAPHDAGAMSGDHRSIDKRRVPPQQAVWMEVATPSSVDDVEIERLPSWSVRKEYTWADGFQALANITRPGKQVAALAIQLYDAASDNDLSPTQKDVYLTVGATFDVLSVMAPGILIVQSVGLASGLIAKVLRNETITPTDIMDMNGMFRMAMDMHASQESLSGPRLDEHQSRRLSPKRVLYDPDRVTQLHYEKVFGRWSRPPAAAETIPKTLGFDQSGMESADPLPERSLSTHGARGSAKVPHQAETHELPETLGSDAVQQSAVVIAQEVERPERREEIALEGADEVSDEVPPHGAQGTGTKKTSVLNASPGKEGTQKADAVPVSVSTAWNDLSAPLEYTRVDGIPLCMQRDATGQYVWQELPTSWYRAPVVQEEPTPLFDVPGPSWAHPDTSRANPFFEETPRNQQLFTVNERDYVTINRHAYAVRNVSPFSMHVFNPSDVSLPPLPVEKWNGEWRFKPLLASHVEDVVVPPGSDGYIRVNNKKYLKLGDKVIETERTRIVGEDHIVSAAQSIVAPLPGAGACGFIEWPKGEAVIEGRAGYYTVRHDRVDGIVVLSPSRTERFGVRYDFLLGQWRVLTPEKAVREFEQGQSGEGAVVSPEHGHLEATAQLMRRQRMEDARKRRLEGAGVRGGLEVRDDSLYDLRNVQDLPFASHWPELAPAVRTAFKRLGPRQLLRSNRRHPASTIKTDIAVYSIDNIREAGYRLLPGPEEWCRLSVSEKQRRAAAYTMDIYDNFYYLQAGETAEAMCSEMTELTMMELTRALRTRRTSLFTCRECDMEEDDIHFLELQINEEVPLGRTGRAHVALLAFKSVEVMERGFGPVRSEASADLTTLRQMQNGDFKNFVTEHKDQLILIDAWGPNKVIDFAGPEGVEAAMQAFEENLWEASFGDLSATIGFSVKPFVPPLSGKRVRHVKAKSPFGSISDAH